LLLESLRYPKWNRLNAAVAVTVSCFLIFFGTLAFQSICRMNSDAEDAMAEYSHKVRSAITRLESTLQDAEAGQSRFANTGDEAEFAREVRERIVLQLADMRATETQLPDKTRGTSFQPFQIALLTTLVLTFAGLLLAGLVLILRTPAQRRLEERSLPEATGALRDDTHTASDSSSPKQTQHESAELVAQLSDDARSKDEFLATLSHELRNSLAPLMNALQLMGLSKLDPQVENLRQMMCRQADLLLRLTDDMLDGSPISRGRLAHHEELVDSPPVRSFRVLVVEDMRALREVMARLLRKLGHEVEFVESGDLALQLLDRYPAEVIFSDIAMPDMTGYELARRIRQRADPSSVYLVALTGFGDSADRAEALNAGFNEHMMKPVDIDVLQALFARLSAVQGGPASNTVAGPPLEYRR